MLNRKQLENIVDCEAREACKGCPRFAKQSCADIHELKPAETALTLLDMLEKTTEALDKVTDWTDCETLGVISPHPIPTLKEAKNLLKKMEGEK